MTENQSTETDQTEDDVFPPVRFSLRNINGDADSIELHPKMLGMHPYLLIEAGEHGPEVTGSDFDLEGAAGVLAIVLAAALVDPNFNPEMKEEILGLLNDAERVEEEA